MYKNSVYNILINKKGNTYLIFNSSSGSLCELEKEEYDALFNLESISPDSIDCFDQLLAQDLIVPKELDEVAKVLWLETAGLYNTNPVEVKYALAPTLDCNLHCRYCFEHDDVKIPMREMNIDKILEYIKNQAEQNEGLKRISISWFGGEPLLRFDDIVEFSQRIIEFCNGRNIEYSAYMITNGLLFTQNIIDTLKKDCNLSGVQITVDGTEYFYSNYKGTTIDKYEKVLENIELCSNNFETTVRLNCSKENVEDLKTVVDILYGEKNLKENVGIYIAPIQDYHNSLSGVLTPFDDGEFYDVKIKFYEYLEEKYSVDMKKMIVGIKPISTSCGLIKRENLAIDPDGFFYACEHDIGDYTKVIGSCDEGIYYNKRMQEFKGPSHPEKCHKCKLFPVCLSGCKSERTTLGESSINCKEKLRAVRYLLRDIYTKDSIYMGENNNNGEEK